jgi:hypothetical protein
MKEYKKIQKDKSETTKIPQPTEASDIQCTGIDCTGEMYYLIPKISHPQYPDLIRAYCNVCGWRGWC